MLCYCPLNWSKVLHLAEQNEVSGLLYQSLQDTCPDAVPANVLNTLHRKLQTDLLKSCYLAQELLQLLQCLENAGIAALAYKGPALAVALYGNLALRPFCDLDILIRPEDLVRVKGILVAAGYDTLQVDDHLELANAWSDSERDFVRNDGRVVLDLHWRLMPRFFPFELPVEELWEKRQAIGAVAPLPEAIALLGVPVASLSPEDLLLALCVHGAKECWSKLKWLCDIAQLLRQYPHLNWEQVFSQAERFHVRRILLLGVGLAGELLDVKLPETILTTLRSDRTLPELMQQACNYLFGIQPGKCHRLSPTQFRLRTRERWQDRLQYGVWRLFVPNVRDRQVIYLPPPLFWLYYPIRLLRLATEKLGWMERPLLGLSPAPHPPKTETQPTVPLLECDRPRCRTDLDVHDLGGELIVYCTKQELGIALNPSSKTIWELCNGSYSIEEIAVIVAQQFHCSPEAVLEDVYTAVLEFLRLGLLNE